MGSLVIYLLNIFIIAGNLNQGVFGADIPAWPHVEIESGVLIGKISVSRNGNNFLEFLGIPYGLIPGRFQISQPAPDWGDEPRDATEFGPHCIQIDEFTGTVSGEENCLTLNVFTPDLPHRNYTPNLPVIFAIHHGGFTMGKASGIGPEYFMDHNVIVVTANYRLGPLGFLNAGVAGARGNQGLKDLVLALKWVKQNIRSFGGDPDRIVVQGSSSGSFAASYLTISPMAKGLLSGAISHAGSALCPWTRQFKPGMALSNANTLAGMVDCPISNPSYLVKCLERLDASVLLKATFNPDLVLFNVSNPTFGPSLETFIDSDDNEDNIFLKEDPYTLLAKGDFNKVPYILGVNSDEGLLVSAAAVLSNDNLASRLNNEWGRVAPNTFIFEEFARDSCQVSSKIRDFYFDQGNKGTNRTISKEDSWTAQQLAKAYGDRWFYKCTRDTALLYSKYAPVFLYNFTRKGEQSFVDHVQWYSEQETQKPPSHADETQYVYRDTSHFPEICRNSSNDYEFSDHFISLLVSFAKNGEPQCEWCSTKQWSPLRTNGETMKDSESSPLTWFQIDNYPSEKIEDPEFTRRMNFWEDLNLREYPDPVNPEISEREGKFIPTYPDSLSYSSIPVPASSIGFNVNNTLTSSTNAPTSSTAATIGTAATTVPTPSSRSSSSRTTSPPETGAMTVTTSDSSTTVMSNQANCSCSESTTSRAAPMQTQLSIRNLKIQRNDSSSNSSPSWSQLNFNATIILSLIFPQFNHSQTYIANFTN